MSNGLRSGASRLTELNPIDVAAAAEVLKADLLHYMQEGKQMPNWLWPILAIVINNPQLQEAAAEPLAKALVEVLPDVTEDAVAAFLRKIADKVEAAN